MKNIILEHHTIRAIIKRVAYQIYETFFHESDEIVLAGIKEGGFVLAKEIAEELNTISPLKVTLCEVKVNKKNVFDPIITSLNKEDYQNKGLVLIDDVLNSGSTLIYATKHFLDVPITKFKTMVLVDRNHKKYPIKANFKGISLSTSKQENIVFAYDTNHFEVYLE